MSCLKGPVLKGLVKKSSQALLNIPNIYQELPRFGIDFQNVRAKL